MNRGQSLQKFFDAYPSATILENPDEMGDRLKIMEQCITDLRNKALSEHSIEQLRDAHTLEHEFTLVCMLVAQRKSRLVKA